MSGRITSSRWRYSGTNSHLNFSCFVCCIVLHPPVLTLSVPGSIDFSYWWQYWTCHGPGSSLSVWPHHESLLYFYRCKSFGFVWLAPHCSDLSPSHWEAPELYIEGRRDWGKWFCSSLFSHMLDISLWTRIIAEKRDPLLPACGTIHCLVTSGYGISFQLK